GLATTLRNIGLPADFPNDVVFKTTFGGTELCRIPIPARATRNTETSVPDGHLATPEPPHRINQIYLEPALLEHAASLANVTLLNRVEAGQYVEHDDHVEVPLTRLDDGSVVHARGKFLIGCDGGRSGVRKQMGV